ncbi:BnaA01g18190D [Brassica napus]|uniref:BnaA01g18190D protein n=1 Tax=Brassica napus TaxID=3708 RepID=A0A078GBX1_BRANA|nr:BnaA01g18190D [Brassica napus]
MIWGKRSINFIDLSLVLDDCCNVVAKGASESNDKGVVHNSWAQTSLAREQWKKIWFRDSASPQDWQKVLQVQELHAVLGRNTLSSPSIFQSSIEARHRSLEHRGDWV